MGDNDLEVISSEIYKLENLNIVNTFKLISKILFASLTIDSLKLVLRDNDLIDLPNGIELLKNLKELHIQSNRLQFLSPNISNLN